MYRLMWRWRVSSSFFTFVDDEFFIKIFFFSAQEKFKREFYKRFSFFHKFGFGKRFHQANGLATGATTLTDYHEKTVSMYNTRASISPHSSHIIKKSCCVRNDNLFRGGNGMVFKNSYVLPDDDDDYTITSNPFIENNRSYNSEVEVEDFEFTKVIIWDEEKWKCRRSRRNVGRTMKNH